MKYARILKRASSAQEVLTAIKDINRITAEVQAGSEEMLKGGEGVAEEMSKLDSLTHVITNNMNEMAKGAGQISTAMEKVAVITQNNKQSIDNLVKEVGKFKTSNQIKFSENKKEEVSINLEGAIKTHVKWKASVHIISPLKPLLTRSGILPQETLLPQKLAAHRQALHRAVTIVG